MNILDRRWRYASVFRRAGALLAPLLMFLLAQEAVSQPLSYEAFVDLISRQHPENEISKKRLATAQEVKMRSGLLPDPQITVGRDRVPLPGAYQREKDSMMSEASESKEAAEWQVGVSQSFPWPGTLSAEDKVTTAQAEVAASEFGLSQIARRFAATELFLRMVRVSKLIEVQKTNLAIVEGVRDFAHAKFKQGVGSHMEFLQTHSETGVLKANIAALETDLRNLKRHATVIINDPKLTSVDDFEIQLEWPASYTPDDGATDFVRKALLDDKDVRLARNGVAYRRSLPSFTASGMLMQDDTGMRMYGAMIGVNVPLYSISQRRSLTRDDSLAQGQIDSELAWHDKQKELALAQAQDRIAQIEANAKVLRLEVIPPVKEHIEAATAQFSQGKADIGTIVEGRRMLLNLQMTEISTSEALALAKLSVEKIQTGLVDMALDQEVPQISGPISGGMGAGMQTGSSPMSEMAKPRRSEPGTKPKGMPRTPSMEDEEPQSGSSGMGM